MKNKICLFSGALVIVFVLMITSISPQPSAIAAPVDEQNQTVTRFVSKADQQAALDFWTRDAMMSTEAMAMPIDYGRAEVDVSAADQEVLGDPGFSSARAANKNAKAIAMAAYPEEWVSMPQTDAAEIEGRTGTSQIFTSYYGNLWSAAQKIYPHMWVGRLSFKTSSGTSYCSATAISNNHFVTAAHCVYDSTYNKWYNTWVFTPAYRNGAAPYGSFPGTSCTILTKWVNLTGSYSINGWTKYDLAVCQAGTNSAGKTLNYMVGWAGRQWNYGYVRNFFDMGYPFKDTSNATLPNAGKYLRICTAESRQQTTDTMGMGCNFGGGISGGPWLINYAPNVVSGYVNSVNSGIYIGQQNLYGIRFTDQNIVILCNAQGC